MAVVFELAADGRDVDRRSAFDLVLNDVTRGAKRNDQLAPKRTLADLAKDERRAAELAFDLAPDGVDGVLRSVEIFDCLGAPCIASRLVRPSPLISMIQRTGCSEPRTHRSPENSFAPGIEPVLKFAVHGGGGVIGARQRFTLGRHAFGDLPKLCVGTY